jgi:DnaJ-class molecular chaperone
MEKQKSHYENLNVSRWATPVEIRTAYKRLAQKHHPDRHQGSQEAVNAMVALNEAYSTLMNSAKRMAYDTWLETQAHLARREVFGAGRSSDSDPGEEGASKWYSKMSFKISLAFVLVVIWVFIKS